MKRKINITALFGLLILLFSVKMNAQLQTGQMVDGIAAVVGNEIVLESDVDEQLNYAKMQGEKITDRCQFLERILSQKLMITEAKKDTLIENRNSAIRERAGDKYNQMLLQFPDEKTMLEKYNFRTSYEMKNAIEKIDIDQYYTQAKYQRITDKVDITPNEVTDFFATYQSQLPEVKDEVTLAKISMYPTLTDKHKQEIIDKLKKIKQDILAGETFDSQARIYSEDGSAANGGLIKNISKGQMVKPFEAAALNLQEGEISDPIESEFGFHIIQLIKKSGKKYDAKHILIKSVPTAEEIETARKELEKIKQKIEEGKISFKEAAFKYSDDKRTKFNGGIMADEGGDKIEKLSLPPTLGYHIAGLNKGDMTDVFEDDLNQRKAVALVKVIDVIPAHKLELATDFDRIKQMALNQKKGNVVEKWINTELPHVFISIDKRYKDCNFKTDWKKQSITK
ncbi:MAG: peptidylprolyl isomerase [Bacteroidetes bacterium]|nr:peptidylprolyl isomerase [Bacteroidota bacterium]